MLSHLDRYHIVLASNSPRRKELLAGLGLKFEVRTLPTIDESYPAELPVEDIASYIASSKADAYRPSMANNELLITADTIVCCEGKVFGKPTCRDQAISMLRALAGKAHAVHTGVCLCTTASKKCFDVETLVHFADLSDREIAYYVDTYQPYDKAGAYGVQEWIGYIGVTHIEGSYFNVMGLPVQHLYAELVKFNEAYANEECKR